MVDILYGEVEWKPVKYWIKSVVRERAKWWCPWLSPATEYFLETEFGSLGPFESEGELRGLAATSGIEITSILD